MYEILKCADVYADACVRNEAGQLMFLSVFGRDTATRELMARIQLATGQDSLRELQLRGHGPHAGEIHTVYVSDPKELDKVTGRLPKCLYGELTHVWIFHPSVQAVDKGAKRAWIIEHGADLDRQQLRQRVWQTVCELADIPLLAHWQTPVLDAIWADMVFEMGLRHPGDGHVGARFCRPIGPVQACQVRLTEDFAQRVSVLIRSGHLGMDPEPFPAPSPAPQELVYVPIATA